jgi:hypothetical protein
VPIPDLDPNGFLPQGTYECTLAEARAVFADSPRRVAIFDLFERYLARLRATNQPIELYVDGGYTTRKAEDPKDIDVVVDSLQLTSTRHLSSFASCLTRTR